MRRGIIAAAVAATLVLVGCSGTSGRTQEGQAPVETEEAVEDAAEEEGAGETEQVKLDKNQVSVGDTIPVKTDRGDLNVTVDGFVRSASMTEQWERYNEIPDGSSLCELTMLVENVSYDSGQRSESVFLDGYVYVNDPDGITINPQSSAWDYGQYEAAPGYSLTCSVGQKKRVAVPFIVSDSVSEVTVVTSDHEVVVPVTTGD